MILISRIGFIIAVLSLLSMLLGHIGEHNLSLISSQISTYAAKAPYDFFITTSILLSSVTLIIISLLTSRFHIFGTGYLSHLIPVLSGAAAAGLILLAYFEETATNLSSLRQAGFMAIRIQSFHDAGLLIFFYSSLALVLLLGTLTITNNIGKFNKLTGGFILSLAPISFFLMTTRWPKFVGFEGVAVGINQRAALLCLWLAFTIMLVRSSKFNFSFNKIKSKSKPST